ncbi:hypothetical protein [Rossellomorea sp. NRS-1567]|uniref:hypothetical protein n=1 Tax=Rossellomorea sp. NRS-1567 TaxID=3233901 RepID=UPI003D266116
MTTSKKKRFLYLSNFLFVLGLLAIILVAYFLIQSIRETFYQNRFENQYEFISLEEEGVVDPVQVFHGVKVNTFLQDEEDSGKKSGNIIIEVKDEPEAKLKGFTVQSGQEGMSAFDDAIQYKIMVENETGNESFIVSMRMTPKSEKLSSNPIKYRTYSINENGVISESNFDLGSKSNLQTQWIRGLSGEKYGYYTNLPYQKGGAISLLFLTLLGILFIMSGIWLRRRALLTGKDKVA